MTFVLSAAPYTCYLLRFSVRELQYSWGFQCKCALSFHGTGTDFLGENETIPPIVFFNGFLFVCRVLGTGATPLWVPCWMYEPVGMMVGVVLLLVVFCVCWGKVWMFYGGNMPHFCTTSRCGSVCPVCAVRALNGPAAVEWNKFVYLFTRICPLFLLGLLAALPVLVSFIAECVVR